MTFAIIGAGAIGSIVAAYLTKAGEDVLLVGRPVQVSAVQARGLTVKSQGGAETIPVRAACVMDRPYDCVIFTVKCQDLEQAYQDNVDFMEDAVILTTQNGVQGDNLLCTHFEPLNMYSSIVMFGATYSTPGEVVYNFPGDWIIGKPYTPLDERAHAMAKVFGQSFSVVVTPDITGMKWVKLFVNFNNCLPALLNLSMQETFADIDFCRLSVMLLKEGVALVKAAEIEMVSLPRFPVERILGLAQMPTDAAADVIQKTLTTLSSEPLYGSVLQSIRRGKTSEIDFINGEVDQLASSLRMTAPLNRKIVTMVHQVERTGKFFSARDVKNEFGLT